MAWLFLGIAILTEIAGTLCLRFATRSRWWFIGVGLGYLVSLGFLSLTLQAGMTLGVAYGIWGALGVAITAVLGRAIFKEPLTWLMGFGIALIAGGVLLIEFSAH